MDSKPQKSQMPLDFTDRGNQFWLLENICERLPEPPILPSGKRQFSRAAAISVLMQLDQLTFRRKETTPNSIATACGYKLPVSGQHANVRRILNWFEVLGIVANVRSTKGGNQALVARLCFPQMDAIVRDGESFGEDPDHRAESSTVVRQNSNRCASSLEPLCVKPRTVVRQTSNRCASEARPPIKQTNTVRTENHNNNQTLGNATTEVVVEDVELLEGDAESSWTEDESRRLRESLKAMGVQGDLDVAFMTVKSWGWSVADVDAHVEHYRELEANPPTNFHPGWLYCWLTREGSAPPAVLRQRRTSAVASGKCKPDAKHEFEMRRARIFKAGRAAGMEEAEIERQVDALKSDMFGKHESDKTEAKSDA